MARKKRARFLVGTSGWSYPHWHGTFYPEDRPKSRWFEHYVSRFSTVEVNATFYRAFKEATYRKWYEKAPAGFTYVLKAPRLVTHRKYLKEVEAPIRAFCATAALLEEKLGMILLQLPPGMPYEPERLAAALDAFEDPGRVAVEFRHDRWLTEEVRDLLREKEAAFCMVDAPRLETPDWVTGRYAYLRLHGRRQWYGSDYTEEELKHAAERMRRAAAAGAETVFAFFNNDFQGFAPKNALRLQEILGVRKDPVK